MPLGKGKEFRTYSNKYMILLSYVGLPYDGKVLENERVMWDQDMMTIYMYGFMYIRYGQSTYEKGPNSQITKESKKA